MDFSIVIPCYNESANLENLFNSIAPLTRQYDVEFILVENGSKDNSKKVFQSSIDGKNNRIKVVYVRENKGYGYGILQGISQSAGKYIGWIHADLQVEPDLLCGFFEEALSSECNIFLKGKRQNRHGMEYLFSYCMGIYDSLLFGHRMKEVMAMPVLFNRELITQNIQNSPFDFSLDIYVYALAIKYGYKINHIPVRMRDREAGESSWNTGFLSKIQTSKKMIDGSKRVKKIVF